MAIEINGYVFENEPISYTVVLPTGVKESYPKEQWKIINEEGQTYYDMPGFIDWYLAKVQQQSIVLEPVIQPLLQGDVSAPVSYFVDKYGAAMPRCGQWDYIHSGDKVINSVNATGGITWSQGGYGAVEDALRLLYPNTPCPSGVQPPTGDGSISMPSPGGSTMWSINTIKTIKGTVERTPGYLLWHITAPFVKDIPYGGPASIPVTYLDQKGIEQIGVYQKGGWSNGTLDYALDNGSYGMGDTYAKSSEVKILSQIAGKTMQIQYPAPKGFDTGTILLLLGAAALGLILFGGKK